MSFQHFELEEWQSQYETTVKHNLADSGCHPVCLEELLHTPNDLVTLSKLPLHYPPVGGTDRLRAACGAWHGAERDNVLITVGAAEANSIAVSCILAEGGEAVVMEPGYRQIRGSIVNLGLKVRDFPLDPKRGWRPDIAALKSIVSNKTRLIAITNPNNPTGVILTEQEIDAIVKVAEQFGTFIIVDEVYRGTELWTDSITPSFWGRYDNLICIGSLSKAFGLPGLRLGWLVAEPAFIQQAWRRHEYATISASIISMHIAEVAMTEPVQQQLLARNRRLIREGYKRLLQFIKDSAGLLSIETPQATALGFVRYNLDIPSVEIAHEIRIKGSVLVAAGSHFGIEHHLRITHGVNAATFEEASAAILQVLGELRNRTDPKAAY